MRKHVTALVVMIAALAFTPQAWGHLPYKAKGDSIEARAETQKKNLAHAEYVCKHGAGEHKQWSCWAASSVVRKNGQGWLRREYHKSQTVLQPVGTRPFPLPACTNELLGREGGWDPQKWNGGVSRPYYLGPPPGSSGAYGGPQALPGSKMASAGPDWATNIWTQIKWMIGYVRKYGGMCGALAFQRANGFY